MAGQNILYLITKANWGGAQRYVYELATAFQRDGFGVAVAYGTPGAMVDKLAEAGIRTVRLEAVERDVSSLSREWQAFKELLVLLRQEKPDILHVNSSKAGGLGALAGRIARVPRIVFTAHAWAWNEDRPWWQKVIIRLAAYATVVLAHETICVSWAMRRDAKWMPFVGGKMLVVQNWVATPAYVSKAEARAKLAPGDTHQTWIGMISELHPTKRIGDAIRAVSKIVALHPQVALVVMGEGEDRAYLEALIKARGLGDRVHLAGFVADGARYLKAFDIFLQASRSESFGLAVGEAGLANVPVVATCVGGIPELVEDGTSGLLVPPGKPDRIAHALTTYLDDPAIGAAYAEKLTAHVSAHFTLDRMLAGTRAAYFPHNVRH